MATIEATRGACLQNGPNHCSTGGRLEDGRPAAMAASIDNRCEVEPIGS